MYYVAVDIGCLECGEASAVLGIFTNEKLAEKLIDEAFQAQVANWHGQHSFEIFSIEKLDTAKLPDYS